jgi:hypothetical protein
MRYLLAPILAALAACAGTPVPEGQASIPFLSRATVRDWHASDDKTLYIQHTSRGWYRADLLGPCMGLPYATVIGFVNERGAPRFNRYSEILVDGERCKVVSLVEASPSAEVLAQGRTPRTVAESQNESPANS